MVYWKAKNEFGKSRFKQDSMKKCKTEKERKRYLYYMERLSQQENQEKWKKKSISLIAYNSN